MNENYEKISVEADDNKIRLAPKMIINKKFTIFCPKLGHCYQLKGHLTNEVS